MREFEVVTVFRALSIDLLSPIGGFEIYLTSCFFRWVSAGLEWE